MSNRQFMERLNKELDNIGVPTHYPERIEVFSKLMKIPKFQAEAYLTGVYLPKPEVLQQVADELEVNADWLIGKSEHRTH